jgi:glycosyltransferase involved in cell wall biosynthesis
MGFSGVQRITKFVKYMKDFNWEPTVLTINPKTYYAFDESLLKEVEDTHIRIVRTNPKDPTQKIFAQSKLKNDLAREVLNRISQTFLLPDNKLGWMYDAVEIASRLLKHEKFDIIFATAPPYTCFRIGDMLKRKFNIPLILDYRDAWLDDVLSWYPTPFHRKIVKLMEKRVLHNSNKIITYTRQIKEHLLIRYPFLSTDDIRIIPHGFDEEDFRTDFQSTKHKNKMRLTYSGVFYGERTPKFFIEAVKRLFYQRPELSNKIEFCFVGNFKKKYEKLITDPNLFNAFNIVGYVDHKESIKYLLDSDVLWLMIRHSKNPHLVATSKLYEYFGAKKPILGCVPEGAASQLLKEYEASITIHPEDIDGIKNSIIKFYEMYLTNQLPKPKDEFIQRFNRKSLTQELVKEFQFQLEA